MKKTSYISIALLTIWSLVTVMNIWIDLIPIVIYWKFTASIAILLVVIVISSLIFKEYIEEKGMKKDNYID